MDCILNCQLLLNPDGFCPDFCFNKCPSVCRILLGDNAYVYLSIPLPVLPPPSPPPPPPPFYANKIRHKHVISTGLSVGASLLGAVLFLGIFCIVSRAYRRRQGNQRRRAAGIVPANFGNQEDFSDENQGPEVDHPIWHIRTVGLQQSVIDAIVVFEYKRGEGLVEGTDCSVCLNEFEDDETLRLLPKCSHAFHLPCIDTWLRSHKNCPVCRAPVVSVDSDGRVDLLMPVSSGLSSREAQIGNSAPGSSGSVNDPEGQDGDLEVRIGDGNVSASEEGANSGTGSSKLTLHHSSLSDHVQVRSDLTELREDVKAAIQPMRRSVSLDSSSALAIYAAVSQVVHGKQPGNLDSTKQSKQSRAKHLDKRGTTGSLSFRKLMTSSLIGKSLQMGPISTKRSFSLRGKSSSSSSSLGGSGRRDSILPLQG